MSGTPPLGLQPRWSVAEHRVIEICEAIARYIRTGWPPPREWIEELSDLTRYLRNRKKDANKC